MKLEELLGARSEHPLYADVAALKDQLRDYELKHEEH